MQKKLFTSEHVSPGHPDKVADQISDMILDRHYSGAVKLAGLSDPLPNVLNTRVAVETLVKNGTVVIAGEVTSPVEMDYKTEIGKLLDKIGYTGTVCKDFNGTDFKLTELISGQSPDIDACVSKDEIGAGDQGIMFGYAVDEAPDFTGWCHYISRMIVSEIWKLKQSNDATGMPSICPDYKVQVTMDYAGDTPKLETVLVSCSHTKETDIERLKKSLEDFVRDTIEYFHGTESWDLDISEYNVLVNPYGPFTIFGPVADSGLTGRKIVCDQYGGYAPVGGGAFSGKDLTKVDRTAAYMARFVAKNTMNLIKKEVLNTPLNNPRECLIEVAYIIGRVEPVSVTVTIRDLSGYSWVVPDNSIEAVFGVPVYTLFKPSEMIRYLDLYNVEYSDVAAFGHMGTCTYGIYRPWEKLVKSCM